MAGSKSGGEKTRETLRAKYGADYYSRIGRMGGKIKGVKKGFALDPKRAKEAGRLGGSRSRRTGVKNGEGKKRQND